MNLQEKVQVIENDVVTLKKGIERIKDRYPLSVAMLIRGNKTGLSLSIDKDFDKVPDSVFMQKTASQS
ncbi:MAG: hypothetical protein V4615_01400 [Bacteroidota bacterium]